MNWVFLESGLYTCDLILFDISEYLLIKFNVMQCLQEDYDLLIKDLWEEWKDIKSCYINYLLF